MTRTIVDLAVGASIAVVVLQAWCVEWFVVASGSMAPALVGPHASAVCDECGLPYAVGVEGPESFDRPTVCPNCGAAGGPIEENAHRGGDRLPVIKSAFGGRSPRRWELTAFRQPESASQIAVKRVVGLPGETIEIRDGDVLVDGAVVRKSLAEQRAMAVLVYDNDHRPRRDASLPPRWRADEDTSRWSAEGSGYVCMTLDTGDRAGAGSPRIDWLTYHHQRRVPGTPGSVEETSVVDLCGYNQTRPVLTRYAVHDLLLSCRVKVSGDGRIAFRARDGQDEFVALLDPAGQVARLERAGRPVLERPCDLSALAAGALVEVSLVDRQFLLAVAGAPLLVFPYDRPDDGWQPTTRPLAIGSAGANVEICDLHVLRDVYYVPATDFGEKNSPARRFGWRPTNTTCWATTAPFRATAGAARRMPRCPLSSCWASLCQFACRGDDCGSESRFRVPECAEIRYIRRLAANNQQ